jgi:histone demethylase JARID1
MSKKSQSNNHRSSSDVGESAVVRTSTALDSSVREADDKTEKSVPPSEVPTTRAVTTSGFTAVNSNPGGFSAINASPSFVAVNNGPPVKREMENGISTPGQPSENRVSSSSKQTPDRKQSELGGTPVVNGHEHRNLKRAISHDSLTGTSQTDNGETDGANGRRSKRLKKGTLVG